MRKVYIEARISLVVNIDEGVDVDDFLTSLELENTNSQGTVEDFQIIDAEITDSK